MSHAELRPFAGISFLGLVGLSSMVRTVPALLQRVMAGRRARWPMQTLTRLALVQTTLVVVLCAWLGTWFGPRLGLFSRLFSADRVVGGAWSTTFALSVAIGTLGGIAAHIASPTLVSYLRTTPFITRLLYGGMTEEVVIRWGGLALAAAGLLGISGSLASREMVEVGALLVMTVLFALVHVPLLRTTDSTNALPNAAVIFAVSLPWGGLALRLGIESAMIAHMAFHACVEAVARWREDGPPRPQEH